MSAKLLPIAFALLGTGTAVASEFERQFEAHEHGHAQMMVALDGKALEIELKSPAMNLVGFEHQARTEAQEHQVKTALDTLKQAYQVFGLPESALCLLDKVKVEHHLLAAEEHKGEAHGHHAHDDEDHKDHDDHADHKDHDDHADHKDHDDHADHKDHDDHADHKDHDDHANHKDHAEHADHEGHEDHAEGGHSDVAVSYKFRCMKPDAVNSIQVNLFKSFPGLEELEVQWVAPSGQGASELTPASNRFSF